MVDVFFRVMVLMILQVDFLQALLDQAQVGLMEVVRCLQEEDQVDIQPAGFPGSPPGTGPGGQPPLTDCGPPGPPEPTKHGLTS